VEATQSFSGFQEEPSSLVKHAFSRAGTYEVSLTVHLDDFQTVTARATVYVIEVMFSSLAAVTTGTPLKFTAHMVDQATGAPPFTYIWRFGDGTTLEGTTATPEFVVEHVYKTAGTYHPYLEVRDHERNAAAAENRRGVLVSSGPGGGTSRSTSVLPPAFLARLVRSSLSVSRGGTAPIKVRCEARTGVCTGEVVLRTVRAFKPSGRRHARKKILVLARVRFTIPAGKTKKLVLHISARGKFLLRSRHTLRAAATIGTEEPGAAPFTSVSPVTLRLRKR
jgi:hypothetical protein